MSRPPVAAPAGRAPRIWRRILLPAFCSRSSALRASHGKKPSGPPSGTALPPYGSGPHHSFRCAAPTASPQRPLRSPPEGSKRTARRPSAHEVLLPAALLQNPADGVQQPRSVQVAGLAAAAAELIPIADPRRQCGFGPIGRRQLVPRDKGQVARVRKARGQIDGGAGRARATRADLASLTASFGETARRRPGCARLNITCALQSRLRVLSAPPDPRSGISRAAFRPAAACRSWGAMGGPAGGAWTAGRSTAAARQVLPVFPGTVSPCNSVSFRPSMKGAFSGSACQRQGNIVYCEVFPCSFPAAGSAGPVSGPPQPADRVAQSAGRCLPPAAPVLARPGDPRKLRQELLFTPGVADGAEETRRAMVPAGRAAVDGALRAPGC